MLASWFVLLSLVFLFGLFAGRFSARFLSKHGGLHPEPSRNQLYAWIDQAPVGWLILDGSNQLQFINMRAARMLQTSTYKQTTTALDTLDDFKDLLDIAASVRDTRHPQRMDLDVAQQELEIYAFVGEKESVALILQSRRSLEAQLDQQERWVSDVAHELKTPLTALLLVGDRLAGTVTDQNAVLVERLLKELRRMQELVADLLELSRLENTLPRIGIPSEPIHIEGLISDAWQGVKPLADSRHVHLRLLSGESKTLPLSIYGDRQRLHRALLNLFDNSLRYSPDGGEIKVELQTSPDWIRIVIKDQGPGLSDQDLAHMFERFYRGDASRFRPQRGGSGLGLSIVQQIVLAHGGWVVAENNAAGGARFELRLPRDQSCRDTRH